MNPPNATWGQSAPGVPICPACSIPVPECQDDPLDPFSECNDGANLLRVTQIRFVDPPRPGLRVVPVPITATAFPGSPTIGIQPGPLALLQNTYPVPDDPNLPVPGLQIDPPLGPIVSGEGKVNLLDAVLARRFVAGRPPAIHEEKCSVIGATECDAGDLTVLRQFLAGLPPGLAQVCSAAVQGSAPPP